MTINVGTPDRIVRIILGLLLILAPFITGWTLFESALWTSLSVIVGIVLIATGLLSTCPAYSVLGINTGRKPRPNNRPRQ